jgi:hypothetical protein
MGTIKILKLICGYVILLIGESGCHLADFIFFLLKAWCNVCNNLQLCIGKRTCLVKLFVSCKAYHRLIVTTNLIRWATN